ncbi:MAG: TlpA disulfide reductase family protein [Acidobacteria bacterium]|nr:TlpA disulfide reductase family protein [Acidobacteriota bacterium]
MRWLTALLLTASATAQITAPIRNKLSAGDLPSAESILEVHEREKGRDAHYLDGLVWVTRGAVLLGAWDRAADLQSQLRALLDEKLRAGLHPTKDAPLAAALGAQIEVQAQVLAHAKGRKPAVAYLDAELARFPQPIGLRSRLYKRRNQLALVGNPAPPIVLDEALTPNPPTLASLRGKPVLIFGWAQWCGDCRSQVAALGRIKAKYSGKVSIITLTRYYEADKTAEKALINKVWAESYQPLHGAPVLLSTAAMARYGVSSTPTFILLDKNGKVTHYLPYRLTEAALEKLLGNP